MSNYPLLDPEHTGSRNTILDEIIASRRTIHSFTGEVPAREAVEAILAAGLSGPYAEAAVGAYAGFRHFIVFSKGSKALADVAALIQERAKTQLAAMQASPAKDSPFLKKVEAVAAGKIVGIGTAPYLIAVAERKGMPPVEQQSLAHCMENMWLKATALGLGFHLVSALSLLTGEPRFWALCGLPANTYAANGFAIGVPAAIPPAKPRPTLAEAVIWLD